MSLDIKIENHSNHCKLILSGACTVYESVSLKNSLLEALNENQNILIDLAQVAEFDTAGLQIFISAKNTASKENKKIKLVSHPISVIAVLDLYGLIGFFGDKVVLTPEEKKQFAFRYGVKKLPSFVY